MSLYDYTKWFKSRHITTSSFLIDLIMMLVDVFIIMLCFGLSFFIINAIDHSLITFRSFINYWIYLPAFLAVFYTVKLYPGIMMPPGEEVRRFAVSSFFCFTGIALSIAVETDDRIPICIALVLAIPFATVLLTIGREITRKAMSRSKIWGIPAIIYSKNGNASKIVDKLLIRKDFGYKPVMIIDVGVNDNEFYRDIPIMKNTIELQKEIKKLNIKVAIILDSDVIFSSQDDLLPIINLYRYSIKIPKKPNIDTMSLSVRDFGGLLGFASTHNLTKSLNLLLKRAIDLAILLIFFPIYFPVVVIISLIVKLTSKGPIFFGHKRIGKNGKEIKTWKFRSMVVNAQDILKDLLESDPALKAEWDASQKLTNDPRITKVGKFLRKTSLDELPQLWNIFLGQMSFVGPRPVVEDELKKYASCAEYVFSVTPGLSGMWQISGRSSTNYEQRILLDMYYIQNWSVWLDLWILIKTIWVVLIGKGAC